MTPEVSTNKRYAITTTYIGNIADNLSWLAGEAIFSMLDSIGTYHSIPLKEGDRTKKAFSTPYSTFSFKVLPFGLNNAPSGYARLMRLVLAGVE